MSLDGRHILLTRPRPQQAALAQALRNLGAEPVDFAILEIAPMPLALTQLAEQARQADWLIFVSPSAIDIAWPVLATGLRRTAQRLATIGHASGQRLAQSSGLPVLYPRQAQDSTALLAESALQTVAGQNILIIKGCGGRQELADTLSRRGGIVQCAAVYQRTVATPDWSLFDQLATQGQLDGCIVTSADIARKLFQLAGRARGSALQCLQYCVPHPRIADQLMALGATRIVTTRADDHAMVLGLKEWFSRHS